MVAFSLPYGCWTWECEWGHMGFDFEGSEEARQDFLKHDCKRSI